MKNCRDIREEYVEYFEEKRLKKRFRSNRKLGKVLNFEKVINQGIIKTLRRIF